MTASETQTPLTPRRPTRADALRNYERLVGAAREAFAEGGAGTSLEEVARRAEVGIGTLYRHFPSRQALLEAVYLDELEAISPPGRRSPHGCTISSPTCAPSARSPISCSSISTATRASSPVAAAP
jgi:AcrR family transcriptional regulator